MESNFCVCWPLGVDDGVFTYPQLVRVWVVNTADKLRTISRVFVAAFKTKEGSLACLAVSLWRDEGKPTVLLVGSTFMSISSTLDLKVSMAILWVSTERIWRVRWCKKKHTCWAIAVGTVEYNPVMTSAWSGGDISYLKSLSRVKFSCVTFHLSPACPASWRFLRAAVNAGRALLRAIATTRS